MKLVVLLAFAICLLVESGGNPVALDKRSAQNGTIPITETDHSIHDRWGGRGAFVNEWGNISYYYDE